MEIVDLTPDLEGTFCRCLADESWDWDAGVKMKEAWYNSLREKGLRVKLVKDEDGAVAGLIQYGPAENCFVDRKGFYFVYCIWVKGGKRKESRQGRGMGSALLAAAEADVRTSGGSGLAVWGLRLPMWMKASWFRKKGYKPVDRLGIAVLLWKPFTDRAEEPRWDRPVKLPEPVPGKATVDAFVSGWCPVGNTHIAYAHRAAEEIGDGVVYREHNTRDPEVLAEWGIADGLYLNGKQIAKGPPMSYEKILKKIRKHTR